MLPPNEARFTWIASKRETILQETGCNTGISHLQERPCHTADDLDFRFFFNRLWPISALFLPMQVLHIWNAVRPLVAGLCREHLSFINNSPTAPQWTADAIPAEVTTMSTILNSLKKLRNRAVARHELDMLSARQLRDLNLERVNVLDVPVYRSRVWNGV